MATAVHSGLAPVCAPKKSRALTPRRRLLADWSRLLYTGRKLKARLPEATDDRAIVGAVESWLADGEALAIALAARG